MRFGAIEQTYLEENTKRRTLPGTQNNQMGAEFIQFRPKICGRGVLAVWGAGPSPRRGTA